MVVVLSTTTPPLSHTLWNECLEKCKKNAINYCYLIIVMQLPVAVRIRLILCWFCPAVYLNKTTKWNEAYIIVGQLYTSPVTVPT